MRKVYILPFSFCKNGEMRKTGGPYGGGKGIQAEND